VIKKYPFYLKSTVILFGLVLFVYAIFNLKTVLIPLCFALLLAILLNPLTNWLQRKKVSQVLAISIALLAAIVVIAGIIYFLVMEVKGFSSQVPIFKQKSVDREADKPAPGRSDR